MTVKDPSDDVYWVELGFLPVEVGYVPNAKAWEAALIRLDLPAEPYPTTDGRCVGWENVGPNRKDIILITVGERAKVHSVAQVAGIIAHECAHAWQHIRKIIGEKEPSAEFEAYAIQAMVQGVMFAHQKKRRTPWRKQ